MEVMFAIKIFHDKANIDRAIIILEGKNNDKKNHTISALHYL